MTEWILAHPYLAFMGWCWGSFCFWMGMPPLVSVRSYTPKEKATLEQQARD